MNLQRLTAQAQTYLQSLCVDISNRRVGSAGNRAATDFFQQQLEQFGFATATQPFACMDWQEEGVDLRAGNVTFATHPAPYSLGCDVTAPLRVVTTVEELEAAELAGSVLLLAGEIAQHQLMPKNFPFFRPEEHQRIFRGLEAKQPAAIVAATTVDPDTAGSISPFPLIEDGDFDIPSVYMTTAEGAALAGYGGQPVTLVSRARRIPATGWNVVGQRGDTTRPHLVCFAHIDAKIGTPGALDNAAGVIVLLLLAELLGQEGRGALADSLGVELVAINGEDYYAAPGEQTYLAQHGDKLDHVAFGINVDGVGYRRGRAAYSLYGCSDALAATIAQVMAQHPELVQGEPWFQSDHFLFIMHERPALALTSEELGDLMSGITHTPADHPGQVDPAKLAAAALALADLIPPLGASRAV